MPEMSPAQWLRAVWPREQTISFAQYMELCLYHPQLGYYEQDATQIGPAGDFITSVSSNPLFAQLLAFQLASWLQELPHRELHLVEAGAHDGTLPRNILLALNLQDPVLAFRVQYVILEPSRRRRQIQQANLNVFAGQVHWVTHLDQLKPIAGVILSNELLDAFPVRRLGWESARKRWFEWGVKRAEESLSWVRLPLDPREALSLLSEAALQWSEELGAVLPDGYTLDLCPEAGRWWAQAARSLIAGRLLTIDYGLLAEELLAPHRLSGTVRAYRRHHQFADVLSEPGQRDLTAHVNFGQLIREGESNGLLTDGLWTQERFFLHVAQRIAETQPAILSGTSRALRSLVHPDRNPFRVLVQCRPSDQDNS